MSKEKGTGGNNYLRYAFMAGLDIDFIVKTGVVSAPMAYYYRRKHKADYSKYLEWLKKYAKKKENALEPNRPEFL